ncbi:MAG: hypothetical protein IPL78_05670 [Chloroflexi bacterium]|nr:hypothetical protein [Chloroflexota bacterium]
MVQNGTLYWVNPDDGEWGQFEGDWDKVKAIASGESGWLFVLNGGTLYQVAPDTGEWTDMGSGWA